MGVSAGAGQPFGRSELVKVGGQSRVKWLYWPVVV